MSKKIFYLLFLTWSFIIIPPSFSWAQKNVTKMNANSNSAVEVVDPKEPQLEDGKNIEEGRKLKEDYLTWKLYTVEENNSGNMIIDYDSLYLNYVQKRNTLSKDRIKANANKTYVIPNHLIPKLMAVDTSVGSKILTSDKYFSLVVFGLEVVSDKLLNQLTNIQQANNKYKLTTKEFVTNILPPVIIDNEKKNLINYEKQITLFFTMYPGYIYYMSNGFAKMLLNKEFDKMYKLQLSTANFLSLGLNENKETGN